MNRAVILPENGISLWSATATATTRTEYSVGITGHCDLCRFGEDWDRIWILWDAQDGFFSPRRANSNARRINRDAAAESIEVIFDSRPPAGT